MAASQSHVTATLLDPKRWPEIDPGTAELITQNRVSATVGADIETVIELEAVDPQAARGLKHVLRGLTILAPKHPKVRGHGALVAAFASAVLERTGKSVSVWLTFPGDLIAEDLP